MKPPEASTAAMDSSPRARVLSYLADHHVMSLATAAAEGPWAAAVFYASAGFDLYFLSLPRSRHAQNIALHPGVAATIQEDYRDWPEIKGIQLEGKAILLQDAEREAAMHCFAHKFPFIDTPQTPAIAAALDRVAWYRLVPTRLYFVDNARGFGHREQIF
jgi:uncharacterized protein YhbP (UPF0306 family)